MRILIIARGYPSKTYPLNGIFEFDQAKALADSGHEVILVALDLRSIRRWRRWGSFRFDQDGVKVEALNLPLGNLPKSFLHTVRDTALKRIYQRVTATYGKPDIVHSHFIEQGYTVARVMGRTGIPMVHTEHYSGMNQADLSPYYTKLGSFAYPKMTQVLAVSEYLKTNLQKKFEVEAIVVPNIVDLSTFDVELKPKSTATFNFISVGRLDKNKRMDHLIQAFALAFGEAQDVHLSIFGDGPEKRYLETLIRQLNLEDRVELLGQQNREAIATKMQSCHCFVLASKLETFGVVLIEAIAMGLPVISTRSGGPESLITPENGLLVDTDSLDDLAKSLSLMKMTYANYDLHQIAVATRKTYRPEAIANALSQLYLSIK